MKLLLVLVVVPSQALLEQQQSRQPPTGWEQRSQERDPPRRCGHWQDQTIQTPQQQLVRMALAGLLLLMAQMQGRQRHSVLLLPRKLRRLRSVPVPFPSSEPTRPHPSLPLHRNDSLSSMLNKGNADALSTGTFQAR